MTPVYEEQLRGDLDWALREGSRHFDGNSAVHKTMHALTSRLSTLKIPYAVVGEMAMFAHGYRRFTEGVDLLVTRESMREIIEKLESLGYVQPPGTSTKLRDTATGVRIEFLISGQFPGDGKPKPVSFPDPVNASTKLSGVYYLTLPALIELKLASGMSAPHRLKDLADVLELIRALKVPRKFVGRLNPSVQDRFLELWDAAQSAPSD